VSNPHYKNKEMSVFDLADHTVVANPIAPELCKVGRQGLPPLTWVVAIGQEVLKE
jgi:hypothetical protein